MEKVKAFEKTVICFTCPFCKHYDEIDTNRTIASLTNGEVECDNCDKMFIIYFDWE
jgi:transcription elongation factor Elf1